MGARFRRLFHRPDEIVLGYDERVLRPEDVRRARDLAPAPLRTMPFRREEPDPGAPVLLTLGSLRARGDVARFHALGDERWHRVWEAIGAALAAAAPRSLRVMVRVDYRGVIVRGDIETDDPAVITAGLTCVPALLKDAAAALEVLPGETQLLTARFDAPTGRWASAAAYGVRGERWVRRFDVTRGTWGD